MKIVIAIDVQNDFIDGSLGVDKNHVISDRILRYVEKCSRQGILTIATRDVHDDNYPNTLEGQILPVKHCIAGTEGYCTYNGLSLHTGRNFDKNTFMSKDLGEAMENLAADYVIDEIEIFGFCTSICVVSNALYLRGLLPNTKISVIENLCGDINQDSHKAALTVMKNCQINLATVDV